MSRYDNIHYIAKFSRKRSSIDSFPLVERCNQILMDLEEISFLFEDHGAGLSTDYDECCAQPVINKPEVFGFYRYAQRARRE
jgi:hypothetical protein